MSGRITFVGAGPGAVDLITLRGAAALDEADLVIYAGSLVNEKLLERAKRAKLVNSAKLSLNEVLEQMVDGYRSGKRVVRLHTGDPAIYGAVSEQYRELDNLGIPYEVVPGVSSVFAAAAALKVELTMPDLSQSVILTRAEGRTPVPEKEAIEELASHGATMCLYLSVGEMERLTGRLRAAGLPAETPVAVVYRASWPNQKIVRGTLADIAAGVAEAGIKRQALVVVGRVLGRDGALSKLYDDTFATGYRNAGGVAAFSGRVAIYALTAAGAHKASEIAAGLEDAVIVLPEKYAELAPASRLVRYPDGKFAEAFERGWSTYDGLVMVMASGVVVRHVAQLCREKGSDPAVVVCDAAGNYAVSLLSGHLGGANRLAAAVARITGGRLAAASVYCSYCGLPAELPFGLTAHAGKVVYAGFGFPELQPQLKAALDKRLTISAVANDPSNYAAAINLLVNKAVNVAPLHPRKYSAAEITAAFADRAESLEKNAGESPSVINLLA